MAVYTVLEADFIAQFVKPYGVGCLLRFRGIGDGIENTNYFVTTDISQLDSEISTASEGEFVLTVFEELDNSDVQFYLNWLQRLKDQGVAVAAALCDSDGNNLQQVEGKPAALFPRMAGEHIHNVNTAQARSVGRAMAKMHLVAQHNPQARHNSPKDFAWVERSMTQLLPFLSDADAKLLQQSWYQAIDKIQQFELPNGIIHSDLFRDNALFIGDDLSTILDLYSAGNGRFSYDLAVLVNDWASQPNGQLIADLQEAILQGYDEVRPRSAEEQQCWPALLQLAAIRFWVSRLASIHIPTIDHRPGALTQSKNPEQYKNILLARLRMASP